MPKILIDKDDAGQRLDRFLRKFLPGATLDHVYKLIRTRLRVNGQKATPEQHLEAGDVLDMDAEAAKLEKPPVPPQPAAAPRGQPPTVPPKGAPRPVAPRQVAPPKAAPPKVTPRQVAPPAPKAAPPSPMTPPKITPRQVAPPKVTPAKVVPPVAPRAAPSGVVPPKSVQSPAKPVAAKPASPRPAPPKAAQAKAAPPKGAPPKSAPKEPPPPPPPAVAARGTAAKAPPRPPLLTDELTVLYRDSDIMAIDKPSGMALVSSGLGDDLVTRLREMVPAGRARTFRPSPAHRLDKETSGVLLCGLSAAGLRGLTGLFRTQHIRKRYRALVEGKVQKQGRIDLALEKRNAPGGAAKAIVGSGPRARTAVTEYRLIDMAKGFSLVEIELKTGRTHQIRAHFAAIGAPLMGDRRYGSRLSTPICLHALEAEFPHPVSGLPTKIRAPLPLHFKEALERLGISAR